MNRAAFDRLAGSRWLGLLTLLMVLCPPALQAAFVWQPATGLTLAPGSRLYDTANKVYYTLRKVTNASGEAVSGPLRLKVSASSHTITNATGTDGGIPYFTVIPSGGTLAPGETRSVRINLQPSRAALSLTLAAEKGLLDSDGDGVPDTADLCPSDAANACITVNGQVYGAGAALNAAVVRIGQGGSAIPASTDGVGRFTATGLGSTQASHDNLSDFLPLEISATGYSTGYAKVTLVPGQTTYEITVHLQQVSDTIAPTEDLNTGVELSKEGQAVGQLTIPDASLPPGVTDVQGTVTYLDPNTDDIGSAPGGDLLALPAGTDPNADPVTLESFGMMEFDLKDQNGAPIHELAGPAEVCMKATPGLSLGDTIPLWWYDETVGLWKEQGQGTVVSRNGQLQICGSVTHFTWWNYDQPVTTHGCFKFDVRDEATGTRLSGAMDWFAEGVTYSGISPERACNSDSDDPAPPKPGSIDSLTVKMTTDPASPERIRVYTVVAGVNYYLVRDGDGTYSLTSNQAAATVFDVPAANGSCLTNTNVENCRFLDYLDAAPDGILPLSSTINYPPIISDFQVTDATLMTGESTQVSATVTDPEDRDPVQVAWSQQCGWSAIDNPGSSITPATDSGPSPSPFTANFTAPSSLSSSYVWCEVTLTATDADGQTSTARQSLYVTGNGMMTVTGRLFGVNGQAMTATDVVYTNPSCPAVGPLTTTTNGAGDFNLSVNLSVCPAPGMPGMPIDRGQLEVAYDVSGQSWKRTHPIGSYGNTQSVIVPGACAVLPDGSTQCTVEIKLPTVWGSISGDLSVTHGPGDQLCVGQRQSGISPNEKMRTDLSCAPLPAAASYGPWLVPVGFNGLSLYRLTGGIVAEETRFPKLSTDLLQVDLGGTAPVTVKVYDHAGAVFPGVAVDLYHGNDWIPLNGMTDIVGEVTFPSVPLGQIYANGYTYNFSFWTTGGGSAFVMGQQVFIDLLSQDTCRVVGTAYGENGVPAPGFEMWIIDIVGLHRATTNQDGQFDASGIRPGSVSVSWAGYNAVSSFIDHCRPVGGEVRVIRWDSPNTPY